MLLVASIPVAALLGVILESPFGALPYFWALGHLSARACQVGAVRPLSVVMSPLRSARPAWSGAGEHAGDVLADRLL